MTTGPKVPRVPSVDLRRVRWHLLEMPLVSPFETSFGRETRRRILLLELEERRGEVGWSESVAGRDPFYSYESVETNLWVLRRYLWRGLRRARGETDPDTFLAAVRRIRGHPMAKAVLEMGLWDLGARKAGRSLSRVLGGTSRSVEVGVSIGLQKNPEALVERARAYAEAGYRRLKLKVEPGRDRSYVVAVRREFPDAPLWIDANQAYGPEDSWRIARLAREAALQLVEQPFGDDELLLSAQLRRRLPRQTYLCLDESLTSLGRLEEAHRLGGVTAVNIKPGRVGGLRTSVNLHDRCSQLGIPVWCGGMLETGIGRAHNLTLASLPNFRLPSDLSASRRYYETDLVEPPFELRPGSTLTVPTGPGIGVDPEPARLQRFRRRGGELPLS
jgi:O-succinylbenzoate synthase